MVQATVRILLSSLLALPALAQSPALAPSQQRALELLRALTSRDHAVVQHFVEESFSPEALAARPVKRRVGMILNETIKIRGGSFVRWDRVTDAVATLVYRNDLFDRLEALDVKVEPAPPHRIVEWGTPRSLAAAEPPPATDRELAQRVDAFAQRLADYDFFSGSVRIERAGQPVLAKAYGLAERNFQVPNRLDTKARIASITKLFTAVAIGQLVEQGKVSLDDPLAKFVPGVPGGDRVRIKHLLSHTSGVGDFDLQTFWRANPIDFRDLDAWIGVAEKSAPKTEPGTVYEYSNLEFDYLGKVIEKASGESYYRYIENRVFKPAGMRHSACPHFDVATPNMAYPYEYEFEFGAPGYVNMMLRDGGRGSAAGCAVSTGEDLGRFARALRMGVLLRPETFAEFTKPVPETGEELQALGFYNAPLGRSSIMTVGHGGNVMGICTEFRMFEHDGTPWMFAVLSNSGLRACYPVVNKTMELLAQRLTGGK